MSRSSFWRMTSDWASAPSVVAPTRTWPWRPGTHPAPGRGCNCGPLDFGVPEFDGTVLSIVF